MIRIELNSAGIKELLKSAEILSVCEEHAHAVASAADGSFEVETTTGANRAWASVVTHDSKSLFKQRATGQIYDVVGGMMK